MTMQELFEAAHLDALGLLDEAERREFETALAGTSAEIQAQVRREQTRLCRVDDILPDVQPPPELREQVLETVRAAIASSAVSAAGGAYAPLAPARRVSPLWRGAALGFATAAIGLAATTLYMFGRFSDFTMRASNDELVEALMKTHTSRFLSDSLFDESTNRVILASTSAGVTGKASLFVNPTWDKVRFFGLNLPSNANQVYRIVVLDERGEIASEVATFSSNGGLLTEEIPVTSLAQTHLVSKTGAARIGLVSFVPGDEESTQVIMESRFGA